MYRRLAYAYKDAGSAEIENAGFFPKSLYLK